MSVSVKLGPDFGDGDIQFLAPGRWRYRGRVFESYRDAYEAREDDRLWGDAYAVDDERDRRRDEGE